jgi:hypothetical protein
MSDTDATGVVSPEVQEQIARALHGLRFGSVEIIVHDSRVVQIERTEKLRLDKPTPRKEGLSNEV